jgi:putative ATPase
VAAGKSDVRAIIEQLQKPQNAQPGLFDALDEAPDQRGAILFLDEIHRFNKAQQDYLLPYVEDGTIILIGATTENPSFEVISALLSRSQVYVLEPHSPEDVRSILQRGIAALQVGATDEALDFLSEYANGDARKALNLIEAAARLYGTPQIEVEQLRDALQSKFLRYDRQGEEHYDTISAYIKSMRASDTDAALYYLARMVHSGEDPLFIARRMVIFASEDVGMADSMALLVANAVFRACETIGYPECRYNLAQGTVYMAEAPKSRTAGDGFFAALDDVERHGNLAIPMKLRNAPTQLMKDLGYGQSDDSDSGLPDQLKKKRYFQR